MVGEVLLYTTFVIDHLFERLLEHFMVKFPSSLKKVFDDTLIIAVKYHHPCHLDDLVEVLVSSMIQNLLSTLSKFKFLELMILQAHVKFLILSRMI